MSNCAKKDCGQTKCCETVPMPNTISLSNNVEIKDGSREFIRAQLRVECAENGKEYTIHTGIIEPNESKTVFVKLKEGCNYKVVIESNRVSTYTSTLWQVDFSEELKHGNYSYALMGDVENYTVRKFIMQEAK